LLKVGRKAKVKF